MEVLKYLNNLLENCWYEQALNKLKEEYGIKVSVDDRFPELIVLNYDQIDSPKEHPIVKECRSLVLSIPEYYFDNGNDLYDEVTKPFEGVSRAFDRFLNLNEGEANQEENLDFSSMTCYEKVDGSLISLFYHPKYGWIYRTKAMLMPETEIMGTTRTWKGLIETTLDYPHCCDTLDEDFTYILEVCGRENRVVTKYNHEFAALLAARRNNCGTYMDRSYLTYEATCAWIVPKEYNFNTSSSCLEAIHNLENLEEGYVAYHGGVPVCKIKSPAYVAAHRLRGNGVPSEKRIMDLIFMNEQDEYIAVFPEDKEMFEPYLCAKTALYADYRHNSAFCTSIKDQKEFALKVKDLPVAAILFKKRQKPGLKFKELFDNINPNAKYKMLGSYL
jgi:T4 RnlA family RNA ligase